MAALSGAQRRAVSQVLGWVGDGRALHDVPRDLRGPIKMCVRMGILTEETFPSGAKVVYRTEHTPPALDHLQDEIAEVARTVKATRCKACGEHVIAARNQSTGRWYYLTPTPVPGGTLEVFLPDNGLPVYRIVHNLPKSYDPAQPTYHAHHTLACRQATLFDGVDTTTEKESTP